MLPPRPRIRVSRIATRLERRTSAVCATGRERRGPEREPDADLRVRGDVRERERPRSRARGRGPPGCARRSAGRARTRRSRRRRRARQGRGDDREQAAALAPRREPARAAAVLGLPRENRRAEHVVEDLVARRRARRPVDAAHDPLARRASRAAGASCVRLDVRVLGEVGSARARACGPDGVTSWRTTRAAASCSAAAARRALPGRARATTARAPPIAGSVASRSSREPDSRSRSHSRSSTSWRYGASIALGRRPLRPPVDRPATSSSTASTSASSAVNASPAQLAVALERAEDRGAAGVAVEPVEADEVREQLGDPAGELVELGQRVVPEREQDVHAQPGPAQQLGQRRAERPVAPW